MADHYKTLGLTHNATKQEIKNAFRKCALKFHPDRHSQSTKSVKDGASSKFKLVSEAYEVLIDDRKRADYDFKRRNSSYNYNRSNYNYNNKGYGYTGSSSYDYRARPRRFDVGLVFQLVTRRGFLLNIAFASVLFGGAIVMERCVETLWNMNNSGAATLVISPINHFFLPFFKLASLPVGNMLCKSFEETIVSVEKKRGQKENN